MASVFKRGGKENRRGCWYVAWVTADGKRKIKSTKTTDKATADRIAAKLAADVALRREGVIDASLDRIMEQERRPLADHLAEFHASLQARDRTAQHCRETQTMAANVIAICKVERIADLTASAVELAIRRLRVEGLAAATGQPPGNKPRKRKGLSARTCNAYLGAIKAFTRWLHQDRRTRHDALVTLAALNEDTDRRLIRRELTLEEQTWLIGATEKFTRPEHAAPGPDRAMLYRLALYTGFRKNELRSLTPASFELGDDPAVTVAAEHSKRGQAELLPLNCDVAELLKGWLAGRPAGERVFARVPKNTARMIRNDAAHARAEWIKAAGEDAAEIERREKSEFLLAKNRAGEVIDFHSLRHSFISAIVADRNSIKTAQELARHSTPTLTIGRYSHARLHDLRGAVDALTIPGIPAAESKPASIKFTAAAG